MNLTELEQAVVQWGHDRNLIDGNTVDRQFNKTWEEVLEIKDAIADKDDDELLDAIGDTTVTLILLAAIKGWTLRECLEAAYDVIKSRTGKTVDGVFIKDSHTSAVQQHVFRSGDDDLDEPLPEKQECTDDACESCQ